METTKLMPLDFTQTEWFAFIEEEFNGHSRLQEVVAYLLMGFGSAEHIGHERASELIKKAVEIFGPF